MVKIRIAYICHFSTPQIREKLQLRTLFWGNLFRRLAGLSKLEYCDSGTWNEDFIKAFENKNKYECFVVGHHLGVKREKQKFTMRGVNYVFFQEKEYVAKKVLNHIFRRQTEQDYNFCIKQLNSEIKKINPDVVVVCGAENAIYSPSVLCVQNKPIFVFLQTLLNLPKRIKMEIGSPERRIIEDLVIAHAQYFGTIEHEEKEYIKKKNPKAQCLKLMFPLDKPDVKISKNKKFDFVFFANGLSKHKGAEDTLHGFIRVCRKYPSAGLLMIGTCSDEYKHYLLNILEKNGCERNVTFIDHFPLKSDMLHQVTKSRFVVLPSITAALNSTVRESMYLRIPTIVYGTSITNDINASQQNLLEAQMENVDDLGEKMIYAYEHPNEMGKMADRAFHYAEEHFSTKSVGDTLEADVEAIINHYYKDERISNNLLLM